MDLTWKAQGGARGTAVLLHGVTAGASTWWRTGPALAAAGLDVTALDLPGHGDAPRVVGVPTLADLTADVAGRLPAGGVDVLLGASLGALVAASVVAADPGAARALVLEEPPAVSGPYTAAVAAAFAGDAALLAGDPERFDTYLRAAFPRWDERDLETATANLAALQVPAFVAGLRGPLTWDLHALLARVTVPVLVLAATDGPLSDGAPSTTALVGADRAAVAAAVDRFVVLDGGHALHRDAPAEWLAAVGPFLDEVLGARAAS